MKTLMGTAALLLLFMSPGMPAQASESQLANFTPGTYVLVDGEMDLCGDGHFALRKNGANLGLGPFHGFQTKPGTVSLPGDAPEDKGCTYDGSSGIEVSKSKTTLTSTEVRSCNGTVKHNLREVAVIHNDGVIDLTAVQVGDHAFNYSCSWKLNKKD